MYIYTYNFMFSEDGRVGHNKPVAERADIL